MGIIGNFKSDHASSVFETSNGDFLVVGSTQSFSKGSSDAWLFKLSESGETPLAKNLWRNILILLNPFK